LYKLDIKYWGKESRKPLPFLKVKIIVGKFHVEKEICKGCEFCVTFCPHDVLELSEEFNSKGYHFPRVKEGMEDKCVACRSCENICPDMAITIEEVEKEVEIVA